MNNAEVLCHSSGPWKKHKYFQKIGEGANAVYRYSKKAAGKVVDAAKNPDKAITGSYYKNRADWEKESSDVEASFVNSTNPNISAWGRNDSAKNAERHGRKAAEAQYNYYNKSLFGKTEKTVKQSISRGQKLIDKLLHPETKITITSNLMPAGTKKTYYKK